MIVVDASAWARALVDAGRDGEACRAELRRDPAWVAPAHAAVETLRTIRRYEVSGLLTTEAADAHATAVRDAAVRYLGPEPWLLAEVWRARHTLSAYDAPYVAIAKRYGVPLVTLDERLARAARPAGVGVLVPH